MKITEIRVGEFRSDGVTLTGPKTYMEERGDAKLEAIHSGSDVGFNTMMLAKPVNTMEGVVRMVLVALQTDYAGWKGARQLLDSLKRDPRR